MDVLQSEGKNVIMIGYSKETKAGGGGVEGETPYKIPTNTVYTVSFSYFSDTS